MNSVQAMSKLCRTVVALVSAVTIMASPGRRMRSSASLDSAENTSGTGATYPAADMMFPALKVLIVPAAAVETGVVRTTAIDTGKLLSNFC